MNKIKSAKYKGQKMQQGVVTPEVWYVTSKAATLGIPEEVMIDNPLFELQYEEPEEKRSCEMEDYTEPIPGSLSYNSSAHPIIYDTQTKPFLAIEPGLTKLELISAMCLQAMLSNKDYTTRHDYDMMSELSIDCAKELLRQLEGEK